MRVLIAEDDQNARMLLEFMLADWGYDVAVACDGNEAWELINTPDSPSLLILDWMMPGIDGVELCRRIRQLDDNVPRYIIFLTAIGNKKATVWCLEAGANDYITKPFDNNELCARVRVGKRVIELQSALANHIEELELEITNRKRAEEQRRELEAQIQRAQKFESLNVMAGSIAHNFNNLLTGVRGNLDLALSSLPTESPVSKNIRAAGEAAGRAAELSTLMLTYVGQPKVNMQTINMVKIVEEMTAMLKTAVSKNVVLKFNLSAEPPFFKGDPTLIHQVIMNLVTNAAEAIGDADGTITLTTDTMFCDHACFQPPFLDDDLPDGKYVCFEVSDTGCGMDEETLARVFDPFFTTKFTGRGLGMAAVLGIQRAHRGAVSLNSHPGKGTTVRVLFPAVDAP